MNCVDVASSVLLYINGKLKEKNLCIYCDEIVSHHRTNNRHQQEITTPDTGSDTNVTHGAIEKTRYISGEMCRLCLVGFILRRLYRHVNPGSQWYKSDQMQMC